MRKSKGFTLIELMIVIAIIAIIAAIAIPGLLQSQRASNERNASTSMKTLASAEADFRANDRDGNKVGDFWTFDVKGLYCVASAAGGPPSATNPGIKLIELSMAGSDADSTAAPGTKAVDLTTYANYGSKAGFWFQALALDLGATGTEQTLKLNTGGEPPTWGNSHNTSKFAFSCWPDTQSAGKYIFIVNENNTIFRSATTSAMKPSNATPPGILASGVVGGDFPSDTSLKSMWSKLD